jgi:hypothetical protein
MIDLQVAETILEQLGGREFTVMTGAKNFVGSPTTLSFSLPGAGGFCKNGINRVVITLEPSDTYTVQFYRIRRGSALVLVANHTDIYYDGLQELFTRETGLAVSL